jgi:hypothetical protein
VTVAEIVKSNRDPYLPTSSLDGAEVYSSADVNIRAQEYDNFVTPTGGFQSTTLQSTSITPLIFDLPPMPHILKQVQLSFTVSNSDSVNSIPLALMQAINKVRFYINGSELNQLARTGRQVYAQLVSEYAVDDAARILPASGISASTYLASFTVAASGSNTCYITIPNPFCEGGVPTFMPNARLRIQVDMVGGANLVVSGSGTVATLSISNVKLYLRGITYHPNVLANIQKQLLTNGMSYRVFSTAEQPYAIASASAGSMYKFAINQTGLLSHMYVMLINTGSLTGNGAYQSLQANALDILKPDGTSLFGLDGSGAPDALLRGPWAVGRMLSQSPQTIYNYILSPNTSPPTTLATAGASLGYQRLDVNSQLFVVPTGSTTSLTVYMLIYFYGTLSIDFTGQKTPVVSSNAY